MIPDFGGFLVKANSEGQPGPQSYGRTHADGAKMLSDALGTHGGVVLWRAFVYTDNGMDRIRQAYDEFKPLDGMFGSNALVQVKNGPLDFQPREPFSPLFGAMPMTPLALELQITKEYLGEDTHLAYLGPLYEEVLKADTGEGARDRPSRASSTAPCTATPAPRSPAWPTSASTRTGRARTSTRPTGTCSAAWRGIRTSRPAPSPTSGSVRHSPMIRSSSRR